MLTIDFLTPVGPGHEGLAEGQGKAIRRAVDKARFDVVANHLLFDDTSGLHGRSAARNRLMDQATADWVFWLDADDSIDIDAFNFLRPHLDEKDAIWGAIYAYGRNENGYRCGQTWPFTARELFQKPPMYGLQIGYCIRRRSQLRHRFNETMNTGEDFDMYARLWTDPSIRCAKIPRRLYLNYRGRHSTGPRSANGGEWTREVLRLQRSYMGR